MHAYTFLTDFRGGTYICQKKAADMRKACSLWKDDIISGGYIQQLNTKVFSSAFDADIDALPPVAIDGTKNVWLFQLLIGKDMLNVHIIQTDTSAVSAPKGILEDARSA